MMDEETIRKRRRMGIILMTRGGLRAWTPAKLGSKLLGQLDADDSDSLTLDTGLVDAWEDTVASVSYTAAAGARPLWEADSFNGGAGVTFDGTDDVLTYAGVPYPSSANPCEIWGLVSQDATEADTTGRTFFGYGNTTATSRLVGRRMVGSVPPITANVTVGTGSTPAVDAPGKFEGIRIVRAEIGGAFANCSMNGLSGTLTAAIPTTATTRSTIGARPGAAASAFWLGVIKLIYVTLPLGGHEATRMLQYMRERASG